MKLYDLTTNLAFMNVSNGKNDELISIEEFEKFLFLPVVPLNHLKDFKGEKLEKIFPYWRKHGLIPFIINGRKLKLSFAQLVWVRILDTLRAFSFTVENSQKVCNYFFKDAYDQDLPKKNLEHNKTIFKKKKEVGTISKDEEILLLDIERTLGDEALLYGLKFDINYLTNLVINSLSSSEDAGILIFLHGEVAEWVGDSYYSHNNPSPDTTRPHIRLSLKFFLKEFIGNEDLYSLVMPWMLTENEKTVIKELRNKNIQEIVIKKDGLDILRIETTRGGLITGEQAKKIKDILALSNYEEISLSTRDEKTLTFKSTRKKINSDKARL